MQQQDPDVRVTLFAEERDAVGRLIDEGFTYLKDRDLEQAFRVWTEATEIDPGNRMLRMNLRRLEGLQKK